MASTKYNPAIHSPLRCAETEALISRLEKCRTALPFPRIDPQKLSAELDQLEKKAQFIARTHHELSRDYHTRRIQVAFQKAHRLLAYRWLKEIETTAPENPWTTPLSVQKQFCELRTLFLRGERIIDVSLGERIRKAEQATHRSHGQAQLEFLEKGVEDFMRESKFFMHLYVQQTGAWVNTGECSRRMIMLPPDRLATMASNAKTHFRLAGQNASQTSAAEEKIDFVAKDSVRLFKSHHTYALLSNQS